MSDRAPARAAAAAGPSLATQQLQRCPSRGHACSTADGCGGELQRSAVDGRAADQAPASVHEVLRSPGRPLDGPVRAGMETRLGHDFSHVRVHSDTRAGESAAAVGAAAYTVGRHVVFAPGRYTPATAAGRQLIAHELTHVVQQHGQAAPALATLVIGGTADAAEREADRVAAAAVPEPRAAPDDGPQAPPRPTPAPGRPVLRRRSFLEGIAGLFRGDDYEEAELQAYLEERDKTGTIEDFTDSDNKARAIVGAWRLGGSPYVLTAQRKALLIREMQSGFTGDDDERAILELLERSYNFELGTIFGPGGVNASDLNSDFHWQEWQRLQHFYERRFEGGMEAVLAGTVQPKGLPEALGTDLEQPDDVVDRELPGAVTGWDVACVLGILCTQDRSVVQALPGLTVKVADDIYRDNPFYDGTAWTTKRARPIGVANYTQKLVIVRANLTCADAVETFKHEVRHQQQPQSGDVVTRELDAYTSTEQWTIERGLPGTPAFRTFDPISGVVAPNVPEIEQHVRSRYAGVSTVPGEVIVNRTGSGDTVVRRPDGSTYTRPPQEGDSYQGQRQLTNERVVPPASWTCPTTASRGGP